MRQRFYAPELMRFIQKDLVFTGILEVTGSLNRHAYVMGNPILHIDPNGDVPSWLSDPWNWAKKDAAKSWKILKEENEFWFTKSYYEYWWNSTKSWAESWGEQFRYIIFDMPEETARDLKNLWQSKPIQDLRNEIVDDAIKVGKTTKEKAKNIVKKIIKWF